MTDQSLKDFQDQTGITVDYAEDINDNNEYFTKIRPNLSQGKGTGRDGMVLTDWMASRLINQVTRGCSRSTRRSSRTRRTSIPILQTPDVRPDPRVQRAVGSPA